MTGIYAMFVLDLSGVLTKSLTMILYHVLLAMTCGYKNLLS